MDFHGKKIYFFTCFFRLVVDFSRLIFKWMRGCAEIGFILPNMRQSSIDYTSKNLKCGKEGVSWLIYISLHHTSIQSALATTTAGHTTAGHTARV